MSNIFLKVQECAFSSLDLVNSTWRFAFRCKEKVDGNNTSLRMSHEMSIGKDNSCGLVHFILL